MGKTTSRIQWHETLNIINTLDKTFPNFSNFSPKQIRNRDRDQNGGPIENM